MPTRQEFGDSKVCKDCGIEKPLTEYYKARSRSTHASYCRSCHLLRTRTWQQKNPDKVAVALKKSRRKNKYGMTPEEMELADSIGFCEICHSKSRLVVDHCHDKLTYRGVLCSNCNTALGMVGENTRTLGTMITYLTERR